MGASPAGWHPQEDGRLRYWDGSQWTEHYMEATDGTAPAAPGSANAFAEGASVKPVRPWFKKKRVLIPVGGMALIVFASALGAGGDTPDTTASSTSQTDVTATAPSSTPAPAPSKSAAPKPAAPKPAAKPKPPASQIGKPVRDGKFEFTVKSVKCGISKVGGEYLSTKAQGQFCAVQLSIENIGDEPQSMFADNQYAFDAKNRKFSADSEASIYDDSSQVLWEEINPGNSVKGKVYFDVPKGAKLTHLELHDSMFSGGVKVTL